MSHSNPKNLTVTRFVDDLFRLGVWPAGTVKHQELP